MSSGDRKVADEFRTYLADRAALRDRIADVAVPFFMNFSDEEAAKVNAGELADAVMAEERDEARAQANLDALADLLLPPNGQTAEVRAARYAQAIHDAMEPDLSLVDQEPGCQALFARAAEAAVALADAEQAALRRLADEADGLAAQAVTDVGAAIVDALTAKGAELSELAEEKMQPSIEERAQTWYEAAALAEKLARLPKEASDG
jgi:hypothetical protein